MNALSTIVRRRRSALLLALVPMLGLGTVSASALGGEELAGTVVHLADSGTDGSADTFVDVGGFDLRAVSDGRVEDLPAGTEVTLRVRDVEASTLQVLSVADADAPARTFSTTANAATPHTVRIAMVVPAGVTQDATPITAAQAQTALSQASQYWDEQTDGKITFALAAPVTDWYTSTVSCSDVGALWNEAANRTGFTNSAREHLVVVVPRQAYTSGACDAYGKGTIGSSANASGALYVTDTAPSLWAHELGHNLSLNHANAVYCSGTSDVTWASGSGWSCGCASCTANYVAYGDYFDVMGPSGQLGYGSLGVAGQDQLGLQNSGITTVSSAGSYTLAALPVHTDGGVYGLRIVDPGGLGTYYVELRGNYTGDSRSSASVNAMPGGVRITKRDASQGTGSGSGSVVLDASPTGSTTDRNWIVGTGSTFTSRSGQVRVTTSAYNGSTATVTVALGTPAPVSTPTATPTTPVVTPTAAPTSAPTAGPTSAPTSAPTSVPTTTPAPRKVVPPTTTGAPVTVRADGSVDIRRGTATYNVRGAILARYRSAGFTTSALGLPVSGEIAVRGGAFTRFENGSIYWSPAGGARIVKGAVRTRWGGLGWENSVLGYPTGEETALRDGGTVQAFRGGLMYSSPKGGAQPVVGAILGRYAAQGYENGVLGYPVSGEFAVAGGVRQNFQGGSITFTWNTGRSVLVRG